MRITREKHMTYLTRLMPVLALAYLAQCYLYKWWSPGSLSIDVSVFVGVGIILVAIGFAIYDQFHVVKLHRHHLSFGIDWLGMKEEVLYRNVESLEVEVTRHAFYNVTLILRDGQVFKLYYLDDVRDLKELVKAA